MIDEWQVTEDWLEWSVSVELDARQTAIYGLVDPRTQYVRYVGKSDHPTDRLTVHLRDTSASHKARWIRSLPVSPLLVILEVCDFDEWEDRERFWISYLRESGPVKLTNSADGGGGDPGHAVEEDVRARISEALTGRVLSDETKARIRAAALGRSPSENNRRAVAESNRRRVVTPETKARMRESQKARRLREQENGHCVR